MTRLTGQKAIGLAGRGSSPISILFIGLAVIAGCTYDASKLRAPTTGGYDGAIVGSDGGLDGGSGTGGKSDSGVDAAVVATGGSAGRIGIGGTGGISSTGGASGGTGGNLDGGRDTPLAAPDTGSPCTYNGMTYQPGQGFISNCMIYTCVSGANFAISGSVCADASVSDTSGNGGVGGTTTLKGTGGSGSGGTTLPKGTGGSGSDGTSTTPTSVVVGTGGTTATGGVTGTGGSGTPDAGSLLSGLLIYYKCESATGTTLPDSSGNGNNGTLAPGTAGYSFSAGKVGNALTLAKAGSGYVSLPAAVFANLTNITVATWVNVTTSQNWQRVFDVGKNANLANNTSTGTLYMILMPQTDATKLTFAISKDGYGSEQVLTSTALSSGTWKHVAVVLASGQETLYVDGVSAASSTTVALRPTDLATIDYAFLGKSQFTADPYFDGKIDEFRVYGRALSATEIQALYQFAGP